MKELKLYRCERCGNLICMVEDSGVTPVCCGENMKLLSVNTQDAAAEKHVPVVDRAGELVYVVVGEVEHPMLENHHIEWIALMTDLGFYVRYIRPGWPPKAHFTVAQNETILRTYAYCNMHGLWMTTEEK